MLNPDAKLIADVFGEKIEKKSTRDGFGKGVVEEGKINKNIVVLSADLKESTRAEWFEKECPDRFIEVGVAEQNMATVAAGLAMAEKIPFITSYATFSPGRNFEQIRTTIALNNLPVKVCGMHAGVSVGPDGATHQMLEDMAMMRALPNMIVLNPCDAEEGRKATIAAARHPGPAYLRFGRSNVPVFTTADTPFAVGEALTLWTSEKPKVALLGTGSMAYNALVAARALESEGIGTIVLSCGSVKPLPEEAIQAAARKTGRVVTVEEHQVAGGFGGAVAEFLSGVYPVPIKRLGTQDQFGQSGEPDELIAHYGLSPSHIKDAAKALLQP
ncbi:transketolase family protein [Candidatus Parcubacteria bacterium]|nr:transketolase family protein [Candidatus Parcubacteria bacterium]